ncbi:class I SAM-dependent methyltransferase [Amycolatopsis sp. 195334CR]|nr:class I SAM-dependent methyltransferase [Amycolatopsis sp. 195334CR]
MARQAAALDGLITAAGGGRAVLDCACGIGTQAIGLAGLGYRVVGSDLSPVAAARAVREATARGRRLPALAADMARLPFRDEAFDVVVCADNSIAHLLTEPALATALASMRRVLRPGGTLVLTVRAERRDRPRVSPVQLHETAAGPVVTFQLWDWHDDEHYDLRHIQLHPRGDTYEPRVRRVTSWAIGHQHLAELVVAAGFTEAAWHSPERSGFFQPVLTGRRPAAPTWC